jgi:hypothetical protein
MGGHDGERGPRGAEQEQQRPRDPDHHRQGGSYPIAGPAGARVTSVRYVA